MAFRAVKRTKALAITTALILTGTLLAGCVYYPSGYGYRPGYYASGYYAPTVVVGGGWGWWGGRGWR